MWRVCGGGAISTSNIESCCLSHTSGGVDERGERGRSEGVVRVGGAVLQGLPQHGEARQTERRGESTSATVFLGEEGAHAQEEARTPVTPAAAASGHYGGRRRE